MDAPSTSGQANRASLFAALQAKITVLKQQIIAAEQSLDQVQPEDIPQLKTALLQVSKMISQMEAAADYLNVQRLNMKNEIRTYQDENIHLQGALIRERRKSQGKDRGSAFSPRWGRGIPPPPPPPPKRENVVYNSMRSYIFPPTVTRCRPLNEDESSVIDLTFDGAGSSASSARTASNVASNPGTSGVRRLRGSARRKRERSLSNAYTQHRRSLSSGTFTLSNAPARGKAPFALSPLLTRSQNGATHDKTVARLARLFSTTPRDNASSGGQNEANENANLNGRLNNRNNRLASKKKMFSIFNSYPSLD
ncbi:unnamed protein product [Ixodes pacificus]